MPPLLTNLGALNLWCFHPTVKEGWPWLQGMAGKFVVWRATRQRMADNDNLLIWFPYEEGNSDLGLEKETYFCNRFHFLACISRNVVFVNNWLLMQNDWATFVMPSLTRTAWPHLSVHHSTPSVIRNEHLCSQKMSWSWVTATPAQRYSLEEEWLESGSVEKDPGVPHNMRLNIWGSMCPGGQKVNDTWLDPK